MIVSERKLAFDLHVDRHELRTLAATAGAQYSSFDIRALGSSKWRHIDEPSQRLAKLQRSILRRVLVAAELPKTMTGGLKGRSLLDHARPHCAKPLVITLDLAHCFPTITSQRIYSIFTKRLDYSPELASMLTKLTTFRRRLPQGTATSPFLAALAMESMHTDIARFCDGRGIAFTQFVDDLALSGPAGLQVVIPNIIEIVQKHGFAISRPKIQVMGAAETQLVTGITVNRGPSIGGEREAQIKERFASFRDALFVLEDERRSLEGTLAFAEFVSPRQAERLRRFAMLCLPLSTRGVSVLRSSSTERRECTRMQCQDEPSELTPRFQSSLPSLGRRKLEGPVRKRRTRRKKRVVSHDHQLVLGLSESNRTVVLS